MEIDNSKVKPEERAHSNLIVEAKLYDTASWCNTGNPIDLLSSNVADIIFNSSSGGTLFLEGKLENPKLWSAEYVRMLTKLSCSPLVNLLSSHFLCTT